MRLPLLYGYRFAHVTSGAEAPPGIGRAAHLSPRIDAGFQRGLKPPLTPALQAAALTGRGDGFENSMLSSSEPKRSAITSSA